jgi:mRNA degradation ribonuclease J1/J2
MDRTPTPCLHLTVLADSRGSMSITHTFRTVARAGMALQEHTAVRAAMAASAGMAVAVETGAMHQSAATWMAATEDVVAVQTRAEHAAAPVEWVGEAMEREQAAKVGQVVMHGREVLKESAVMGAMVVAADRAAMVAGAAKVARQCVQGGEATVGVAASTATAEVVGAAAMVSTSITAGRMAVTVGMEAMQV